MTTITRGATTITPSQVLSFEAESDSRNVEHKVIDSDGISVTLAADEPRTGRHELLFETRAEAWEAHRLFATAGVNVMEDTEQPEINMHWVRRGSMKITLDMASTTLWTLTVGYREVLT